MQLHMNGSAAGGLLRNTVTAFGWLSLVVSALIVQYVAAIATTSVQSCSHLSGEIILSGITRPPCTIHSHLWIVAALRFGAVLPGSTVRGRFRLISTARPNRNAAPRGDFPKKPVVARFGRIVPTISGVDRA